MEKNTYNVLLQSADKNMFEVNVHAQSEAEAGEVALNIINVKGWSQYNYNIFRITLKLEEEQ